MKIFRNIIIALLVFCICSNGFAQNSKVRITQQNNTKKTRILFVIDCSYNMYERWQSNTKIKIIQSLVSNIVDSLAKYPDVEVGLRVFGSEKDYSLSQCDDTHLLVPFYKQNQDNIKAKLKALVPKGTPAIAKAMEKAAEDFPKDNKCRNIVILIANNIDKCDGDVVQVSNLKQKQGSYIKPFIIGISKGMKNIYEQAGLYQQATKEIEFSNVLNNVVKQALHNTSVQINLLDSYMEATETNVPITMYDSQSKKLRYSFIHTINAKGISDTINIDPLVNYDIIVHTIPPIKKENVTIAAGSHTIIPIQSPQGAMIIKYVSTSKTYSPKNYPVVVRQSDNKQTINVQNLNKKEKYLVGKYDLEVLSLPRLLIENVEIGQSSTTTIEIPECGTLRIDKQPSDITGSIFLKSEQETKWVKNLDEGSSKELVDLMPGEYLIVAKSKSSQKVKQTIVQEVKIESNKTTNIVLSSK